jgi:hypothetical protein
MKSWMKIRDHSASLCFTPDSPFLFTGMRADSVAGWPLHRRQQGSGPSTGISSFLWQSLYKNLHAIFFSSLLDWHKHAVDAVMRLC